MGSPIRLIQRCRLIVCMLALASTTVAMPAHAGPIELFRNTRQNPDVPDQLVAAYIYGGGGLFVSADGGKTSRSPVPAP